MLARSASALAGLHLRSGKPRRAWHSLRRPLPPPLFPRRQVPSSPSRLSCTFICRHPLMPVQGPTTSSAPGLETLNVPMTHRHPSRLPAVPSIPLRSMATTTMRSGQLMPLRSTGSLGRWDSLVVPQPLTPLCRPPATSNPLASIRQPDSPSLLHLLLSHRPRGDPPLDGLRKVPLGRATFVLAR